MKSRLTLGETSSIRQGRSSPARRPTNCRVATISSPAQGPGGSSLTVHSSTIQETAFAAGLNPLFIDADGADNIVGTLDDDCRLAITSPCIDFGDNAWIDVDACDVDGDGDEDEFVPLDLDAHPRRVDVPGAANSGGGRAPHVDRGSYEHPLSAACADLNGDELVNGVDLSLLLGNWGLNGGGPNEGLGDLDGDGTVGAADLATLLGGWGPCDGGPW